MRSPQVLSYIIIFMFAQFTFRLLHSYNFNYNFKLFCLFLKSRNKDSKLASFVSIIARIYVALKMELKTLILNQKNNKLTFMYFQGKKNHLKTKITDLIQ